jgi:predicted nuclease of predicted toxin-antitoxin system
MALTFYMDQHVPKAITVGLRLRAVDVMTAYDDGAAELTDPALLDRASDLRRVLFTQDDDLLSEAVRRQRASVSAPLKRISNSPGAANNRQAVVLLRHAAPRPVPITGGYLVDLNAGG